MAEPIKELSWRQSTPPVSNYPTLCSDMNTGSNTTPDVYEYQSHGRCTGYCGDYVFAIMQAEYCWCSNDAPDQTTSIFDCDKGCPGYPQDSCGGDNGLLFAYQAVSNLLPSGTTTGATVTPSSTGAAEQSSTTDSESITSHTSTSSASSTSSTWTPTPVTSVETVTGHTYTVTVTPTVPPNSQNLTGVKQSKSGLSTGAAVGLTVGLVALIGIIGAIVFFCFRKRRQEMEREEFANGIGGSRRGSSAGLGGPVPSRTMSESSRYFLGTDGRQVVETWEPGDAPGSRRSRLMPVDPRLDPMSPVYQQGNKSRESVNTIRDDHDYSRRVVPGPILRATNPD